MLNSNVQSVNNGNNNTLVGGDYIQNINNQCHIEICEFDILKVINQCYENMDLFGGEENDVMDEKNQYDYIEKEKKNMLNNLSDEYFEIMKESFLPYFHRIDEFLGDPKNKQFMEMYKIIALRLKNTLEANRDKNTCFEKLLSDVNNILSKKVEEDDDVFKPFVITVFINFMYWNCDIVRKEENDFTRKVY